MGKTILTKLRIEKMRFTGKSAPSGNTAALILGGYTVHSLSRLSKTRYMLLTGDSKTADLFHPNVWVPHN